MTDLITSSANPLIKRVRLLGDRRNRRREGAFVVQGAQPVWQAVEAGADIEVLLTAPDLLRASAAAMVAEQEARGVAVARLSGSLFARIADRDGPAGLAAIVRGSTPALGQLRVRQDSVFVALHEIANPGNLGTIIRTADAAGAAGVILVGPCTDPFDPAAVKASMGALFGVPIAAEPSPAAFLDWCHGNGVAVAVTSAAGAGTLWDTPIPRPVALLLGSEGPGLPGDLLAAGDLRLRIPMTGTAESLNLAVATGILLYETWRRFRHESENDGQRTDS
ncbi:MAG TPA: RNA methyltransferase [Streptosporangiaceae bacterium]|nr:RNA methyltransferase [Streptosporangiaceae bacterium]